MMTPEQFESFLALCALFGGGTPTWAVWINDGTPWHFIPVKFDASTGVIQVPA